MSLSALDFPYGRPLVAAVTVRRNRILPVGATALVSPHEEVTPGQAIAEARGSGGLVTTMAGIAGRVAAVSAGQSITLEGMATLINGLVGVGGQVAGPLFFPRRGEAVSLLQSPPGCIIVYPMRAPLTLLQRALANGAVGVIAASATALELEAFARTDMTALLDGFVPLAAQSRLTVMLTEGMGESAMHPSILNALEQRANDVILLNGQTLPRRNIRPEALLPLPSHAAPSATPMPSAFTVGTLARIASGASRGMTGRVLHIFTQARRTEAGQWEPSALLRLDDGATVVAPLALLDSVG